jgi:hypothetical protein
MENTRIVSIGAGIKKPEKLDPKKVNVLTWVFDLDVLLNNVQIVTNNYFSNFLSKDFHRL